MKKNIIDKVNTHITNRKKEIHDWIDKNISKIEGINGDDMKQEFLEYIYDQEKIELNDEDFKKRKRISNKIPNYERCCAKKSCGTRCTRKKKDGNFCGTHSKACPYGSYNDIDKQAGCNEINIWLEETNGIYQYKDINNNVYSSEDIIKGERCPRKIN